MNKTPKLSFKERLYVIIFEADTNAGKRFDVILLWLILLSVLTIMLESVSELKAIYFNQFLILEWVFTALFSIEYIARIYSAKSRIKYITSFYGWIDLLSILPTYLSLFYGGFHYMLIVRSFRLLRVFRILKLTNYLEGGNMIKDALLSSRHKVIVFLGTVLTSTIFIGTLMYLVEGPNNGFDNIPKSVYWAIVTLTTVGYGDIVPLTDLGRFIASALMILGYAIIAVPTGIVTSEMINKKMIVSENMKGCYLCNLPENINEQDNYCRNCGRHLT